MTAMAGLASAEDASWKRFQNGGKMSAATELPTKWSPTENIAWTADITGYGQSTPIVARGQIVVTSTSGDNKENYHVTAFSSADGSKVWQVDLQNPTPYKNTPMVSRAAPSAVASPNGFVAFFEGGLLVSISKSGQTEWERNLVEEYGAIEARHGIASSLEANDKFVFVWVERIENPYLMAIDPATGKTAWKSEGAGSTAWSSPRLVPVDDGEHLVCSAIGKIIGFDPETGDRLWEFDGISNNSSNTPTPVAPNTFLIGASNGRGESNSSAGAPNNGVIEISKADDGSYTANFKWQAEKATSSFGSPVVAGDTAAIVNRSGVLYRLDLETGKQVSIDRTDAGGIWATPLVVGDRIYLFGYKGTTTIISLTDGKEVAENRCWPEGGEGDKTPGFGGGDVLYAAVPMGNQLLIRRGDKLFAIGNK
ncbi:MAG: PQQ-binding-like beta-propeller repeat protein [Planctomycetota bacterium]